MFGTNGAVGESVAQFATGVALCGWLIPFFAASLWSTKVLPRGISTVVVIVLWTLALGVPVSSHEAMGDF